MIRSRYLIPILILASLHLAGCSGHGAATPDMMSDTLPHMTPDYSGRPAVPRNIAPLRFRIDTPADAYQASIALSGSGAPEIVVNSSDGEILIPEKEWSSLLDRAAGSSVEITTATRTDGRWTAYPAMTVDIDTARLDDWLVYRLIYPGYELWSDMGIYQRCPATFEQQALLENKDAERQCMNCHSFAVADPSVMMLHVRGPKGGTAVMRPGKVGELDVVEHIPALDHRLFTGRFRRWRGLDRLMGGYRRRFRRKLGAHGVEPDGPCVHDDDEDARRICNCRYDCGYPCRAPTASSYRPAVSGRSSYVFVGSGHDKHPFPDGVVTKMEMSSFGIFLMASMSSAGLVMPYSFSRMFCSIFIFMAFSLLSILALPVGTETLLIHQLQGLDAVGGLSERTQDGLHALSLILVYPAIFYDVHQLIRNLRKVADR